jgi:hypothetical protein
VCVFGRRLSRLAHALPGGVQQRQFARPAHEGGAFVGGQRRRQRQRLGGRRFPHDLVRGNGRRESFERQGAGVAKCEVAARADEAADEIGEQDLPALGTIAQPLGNDHGRTEVVVLVPNGLADVQADTHLQVLRALPVVVPVHRLLHRDGTADGIHRAGKGHHEAVTEILHFLPAARGHRVAQQPKVGAPHLLRRIVTQPLEQLGRVDEVGEEQRHSGGGRCHWVTDSEARRTPRRSSSARRIHPGMPMASNCGTARSSKRRARS